MLFQRYLGDGDRIPLPVEESATAGLQVIAELLTEAVRTIECNLLLPRTIESLSPRRHLSAERRSSQVVVHLDRARCDLGRNPQTLLHIRAHPFENAFIRIAHSGHVEERQPGNRAPTFACEMQQQ